MYTNCNDIVEHFGVNFKEIEETIRDYAFKEARKLMRMTLEEYDALILSKIDPRVFENKGLKKTSTRTLFGKVEYKRRLYDIKGRNCKPGKSNEGVHLLDVALGLNEIGKLSPSLIERIVDLTTEMSFEKAAANLSKETGESISRTAVWEATQKCGRKERGRQQADKEKLKQNKEPAGEKKKTDVLFVEADGIHLTLQGKDRKKHGKTKEMKTAVMYEGWEKRHKEKSEGQSKEAYLTMEKKAIAGIENIDEFKLAVEAKARRHYDFDNIDTVVLGGDGGKWIKNTLGDRAHHFQLDRFHLERKITDSISDSKARKEVRDHLEANRPDSALERIELEKYECGGEVKEVKKLEALQKYLIDNIQGLSPWQQRGTINPGEPPKGVYYRRLGTMEHQVCDLIKLRMKGNKCSWSVEGANNMAALRCKKMTEGLNFKEYHAENAGLPERYTHIYEVVIEKEQKAKKTGKGYTGGMKNGGMPFRGQANTPYRKAVREMIERMGIRF